MKMKPVSAAVLATVVGLRPQTSQACVPATAHTRQKALRTMFCESALRRPRETRARKTHNLKLRVLIRDARVVEHRAQVVGYRDIPCFP
jgi:hypothetical protein